MIKFRFPCSGFSSIGLRPVVVIRNSGNMGTDVDVESVVLKGQYCE